MNDHQYELGLKLFERENVKREVYRIASNIFNITENLKLIEHTVKLTCELKDVFKNTKYSRVKKIVPIILYVVLRKNNFNITFQQILDASQCITKREFAIFFIQISRIKDLISELGLNDAIRKFISEERELEFKINDYINLKLEFSRIHIYIGGKFFIGCKYLLLNIPVKKINDLDEIRSIDEASLKLDNSMEGNTDTEIRSIISLEEEFWGHASNLQAWAENYYDTRLLHSNLSFPLLKSLTEAGDLMAKKVFKEEIAKRFLAGFYPTTKYLIKEGYVDLLNKEELSSLFLESQPRLKKKLQKTNKSLNEVYLLKELARLGDESAEKILENYTLHNKKKS